MQCSWTWWHWHLDLNWLPIGSVALALFSPSWTLVVENIENRCVRERKAPKGQVAVKRPFEIWLMEKLLSEGGMREKWQHMAGARPQGTKKASKHLSECWCFTGEEEPSSWLEKTGRGDSLVKIISIIIIVGVGPSPPSFTSAWCYYSSHFID